MVIVDVSDVAEVQSRLEQSEQELRNLENRFQENNLRLKVLDMEKNAVSNELVKMKSEFEGRTGEMTHIHIAVDEKQKELETINESLVMRSNELQMATMKLQGIKSVLDILESEKQKKLDSEKSVTVPGDSWKEKIKIYDEIDKCLNVTDNGLKTKKLKDDELK
jgi:chromosome segregation ATPase